MRLLSPLALPLSALQLTLLMTSCAPAQNQGAVGTGKQSPAKRSSAGTQSPQAATDATSSEVASAPAIDRSSCGLPEEIREADWPRVLSPTQKSEPAPAPVGSMTIAVLPDTQYYASCRERHILEQSKYIAAQEQARNIFATIHLGDLTEHNTPEEWSFVQEQLAPIPSSMPLLLATGNHDHGDEGEANRRHTLFNEYFNKPSAATWRATARTYKANEWENAFYRLPYGTSTLSIMILEWSPRTAVVKWAKEVLKEFPNDRLIFVTHAYTYHDNSRYNWEKFGEEQKWNPRAYGTAKKDPLLPASDDNLHDEGAYDGEMLWQELLADYPGLFLTLNGHVLGDGAALVSERGKNGNLVHQVLSNFQMLDEGGLGYLRLVELFPDGKSLRMKTYSPSLDLYATAADQQFDLLIEPPLPAHN